MADFHQRGLQGTRSVFGKASSNTSRKSGEGMASAGISPPCPQCGSKKVWRDGLRYSVFGDVIQRWLCRDCGLRFSDSEDVEKAWSTFERLERVDTKKLRARADRSRDRRIRVSEGEMINLAEITREETAAGATKPDQLTKKGLLLQYQLYLEKEGYGKDSQYRSMIRMLLNSDCNVYDPENVKEAIAKKKWKDGTKMLCCYAYDVLTKMLGLTWIMPTYRQEEYIFFLPEEAELDVLINATRSQRMRTYLQTLKEVWADPSEGLGLRWIDVDANRNVIIINKPVKDHYPREIEVSPRLIAMINNLPKTSTLIFPMTYATMYVSFRELRKRVAYNTQNPRILSISPTSFRHWGGTMLAWLSNGNVPFVQEKLGHKRVENTMKYIKRTGWKLVQDFEVVTASTEEEIKKYGEAGYQKYDERTVGATHVSYYRRPKRFGSLKV